jgi:virginiamycin B lyase
LPAVEPLEGRTLLSTGGDITPITTLPAPLATGPMAVSGSNLWFAETGRAAGPALAKLSATGVRTETPLPAADAGDSVAALAVDGSGDVWYTLDAPADSASQPTAGSPAGKIGRVAPGGTVTEFPLPSPQERPGSATIGSDGNLWVAVTGGPGGPAIARVSGTGSVAEFPVSGATSLTFLTKGPDGNIWFVDGQKIGKITPAGAVTEYPVTSPTPGLAVDLSNAQLSPGSDGNVWFIGLGGISKITPTGTVSTISAPGVLITSMTAGAEGNLWLSLVPPAGSDLAQNPGEVVIRLTTDGQTTPLAGRLNDATMNNVRMVSGDGALWIDEGGTALSWVNLGSIPTVTPQIITPTTPHPVFTNARKTITGPIVSFTANYDGAQASDFTATINYGDGYTGTGTVVADPNGGFDVIGYDTYKLPIGTNVKVTVDVTGPGGQSDEIYGVVQIGAAAQAAKAARAAALAAKKAALSAKVKASKANAPRSKAVQAM